MEATTAGAKRRDWVGTISGHLALLLSGLLIGSFFKYLVDQQGPGWYVPEAFFVLLVVTAVWVTYRPSFTGSVLVVVCVSLLLASAAFLILISGYTAFGVAGLVLAFLVLLFCGSVLWKIEPAAGWWARLRAWLVERPGDTTGEEEAR